MSNSSTSSHAPSLRLHHVLLNFDGNSTDRDGKSITISVICSSGRPVQEAKSWLLGHGDEE